MNLSSKYSIGDVTYRVSTRSKSILEACPSCEGLGKIIVPKATVECPTCNGKGVLCLRQAQYFIVENNPLTIGQIRIEHETEETKIQYMCKETGIGSGSIHNEKDLYESQIAAQEAANKRNSYDGLETFVCPQCNPEAKKYAWALGAQWKRCPIHGDLSHAALSTMTGDKKD